MTHELEDGVWLVSRTGTNLTIDLAAFRARSAPNFRRSKMHKVPVTLKAYDKMDVTSVLDCSAVEARRVISMTPEVQKYIRRGYCEVR